MYMQCDKVPISEQGPGKENQYGIPLASAYVPEDA